MRRLGAHLLVTVALLAAPLAAHAFPSSAPSGAAMSSTVVDRVTDAKDLPSGTLRVTLLDEREQPLPNRDVVLRVLHNSVAEGNRRTERHGTTDASGTVLFDALAAETAFSYVVQSAGDATTYASDPFEMNPARGKAVVLHVLPSTPDIDQTMSAGRLLLYLEPKDDVIQAEVLLEYVNIGKMAWVPSNVSIPMPAGWKAFKTEESGSTLTVENVGDQVFLRGSLPPGNRSVSFRFQVPRPDSPSARVELGTPPRLAELQVMAEAPGDGGLSVAGFPPAERRPMNDERKVWFTHRTLSAESGQPVTLSAELSGLPVRGPGRWVALWAAAPTACTSRCVIARRKSSRTSPPHASSSSRRSRSCAVRASRAWWASPPSSRLSACC